MKKYFLTGFIALLALAFVAAPSGMAFAQNAAGTTQTQVPSFLSCVAGGGSMGTCIVYAATWFVAGIMGLFISLGGVLIKLGLAFNQHVYDSPFIQTGFGICLSLANLGFVLAIIVIALATILRSETYGYKKSLWRLVVMAILVNFGLVITAPIVNFANSMTIYFTNAVSGAAGIDTLPPALRKN